MEELLKQAEELIASQATQGSGDIPTLAKEGKTGELAAVFKETGADTRKTLHYFAQSEAERGVQIVGSASRKEIPTAFHNIAKAFELANEIDKAS